MKRLLKLVGYTVIAVVVYLNLIIAVQAYKFSHFYDVGTVDVPKLEQMTPRQKVDIFFLGLDYPKSPITGKPAHAFDSFQLTTADDILLQGWYVPKNAAKGTVILFHGHGGNRSSVVGEANAFYSFGYNVCMIDFRAHGESSGNTCTIGYYEAADVKAAYDYVAAKGEKDIVLWGISLGAATITKAMTDYPDMHPAKVILEMPFGSLPGAIEGRLRMLHLPEQPVGSLLTFWGGAEHGFWAFKMKPEEYARNIHVPVLLQWGKQDIRVTEAETNTIYKNLGTAKKELILYSESKHSNLLNQEPVKWRTTVNRFLEQ